MIPDDLRYNKEHEWIRNEQGIALLGITDFAQNSLGDIVYVEVPKQGERIQAGQEIGEVESTKTTSPIYSPVNGTILAVNEELKSKPELINSDPYKNGWIAKIKLNDQSEVDALMTAEQYGEYLKNESHP